MNKLLIGAAATALIGAMAPAVAQTAPPPGVAQGTTTVVRTPVINSEPHVRVITDREMTRDEAVRHVRDLFAKLDANRDGYVTREEAGSFHDHAMRRAHQMVMRSDGTKRFERGDIEKRLAERGIHIGDRGATFDRLDTNKDGSISRQEFTTAQPQMRQERVFVMRDGVDARGPGRPGTKMRMHRMGGAGFGGHLFDRADANKDNRVSLAEAQAAVLAHFDRADTNRDGRITPDERRNVRVMRMERRGS
jgi:hypothetical protein